MEDPIAGSDLGHRRRAAVFEEGDICIPVETVAHLIEKHTNGEQGVRNLKRCLEVVHTKLNLYRLMKPGSNLFEKDMALEVSFPFTVTKEVADKLIRVEERTGAWRACFERRETALVECYGRYVARYTAAWEELAALRAAPAEALARVLEGVVSD